MTDLYFAYGSNLNLEQFEMRCPAARPVGRMTLPNYQLVFRRVADIVPTSGCSVPGGIYQITPACEMALDLYEGWPRLYRKEYVPIRISKGRKPVVRDVMFYVMNSSVIEPPPTYYLETIRTGYDDWNIPHDTLDAAVAKSRRATKRRRADAPIQGKARGSELRSQLG